jgi:hypothetical protein
MVELLWIRDIFGTGTVWVRIRIRGPYQIPYVRIRILLFFVSDVQGKFKKTGVR